MRLEVEAKSSLSDVWSQAEEPEVNRRPCPKAGDGGRVPEGPACPWGFREHFWDVGARGLPFCRDLQKCGVMVNMHAGGEV